MEIGIIGTGDMGTLEAKEWVKAGFTVNCCDLPENREKLEQNLAGTEVNILDNPVAVARRSGLVRLLVPVDQIENSVREWGPSTKKDAIVSSGTSVMTPAVRAFKQFLPEDVNVINWHWLFGPSIKPQGQSTALVRVCGTDRAYQEMQDMIAEVRSRVIELPSYNEHDKITADTQAVTHVGFLAMGTAWKNMGSYPWENPAYAGGVDNVKVAMLLRILGGKSHVYSGLAIHNPYAGKQISQYAKSNTELFSLMIQEDKEAFRKRVIQAGTAVFNNGDVPIMLDDKVMGEFSLGKNSAGDRMSNSHLSLLSMVDAWYQLGINPYSNMVCQTPVFRLRLGIAEYFFRDHDLLEESIHTALHNKEIRRDDLAFHTAVTEWDMIVRNSSVAGYHSQFEETRAFFVDRIPEGMRRSGELIRRLSATQ